MSHERRESVQEKDQAARDREERFAVLDRIGEAFRDVPEEEVEREVAKAIAEVRAENRRGEGRAQSA